jgi:hypothetical protein
MRINNSRFFIFHTLKPLRYSFILSGVYDLLLGMGLLLFMDFFLVQLLGTTRPKNLQFPQITGLFLLVVGYFQLYGSQDVQSFAFLGFGMAVLRLSFGGIVLLTWLQRGIEGAYLIFALSDFLLALVLILPLLFTEGVSIQLGWRSVR